jgi:uncharacterized membrane protein
MTTNDNQSAHPLPEPKVGRIYGFAWKQMWKYFLPLFLVSIIYVVLQMPLGVMQDEPEDVNIFAALLGIGYFFLFLPVISYGASYMFLKTMREEKFEIREMFSGFNNYLNVILANLLVSAIVGFGIILLIVPGILMACRLAFVPYLVMDKGLEPIAAVERSWEMTRGYGWKIFGMGVLAVFIIIAGLLLLFVGIFFAAMWVSAAFATIYHVADIKTREITQTGQA